MRGPSVRLDIVSWVHVVLPFHNHKRDGFLLPNSCKTAQFITSKYECVSDNLTEFVSHRTPVETLPASLLLRDNFYKCTPVDTSLVSLLVFTRRLNSSYCLFLLSHQRVLFVVRRAHGHGFKAVFFPVSRVSPLQPKMFPHSKSMVP